MDEKLVVKLGHLVELDLIYRTGERERMRLTIIESPLSDLDSGLLSNESSLAKTILGEEQDCIIPYFTDELEGIHVISVSRNPEKTDIGTIKDIKSNRRDILSQIEFREALLFASSSDTKWGSYDADSLKYETWADVDDKDSKDNNPDLTPKRNNK
jgi:hypothetical protein